MTDERSPDPLSRSTRLATRRRRVRVLSVVVIVALIVVGVGTGEALKGNDDGPVASPGKHALGPAVHALTDAKGSATKQTPLRKLDHQDPLRLWIGGDSLAGSFGIALGATAGATGIVDATVDYKVSSGLADNGIRNWVEHAQETMASENPDAVVFIIGTNDASIVNSQDSNNDGEPDWEVRYRQKIDEMMLTFVGGDRHRTVYWLGPPTLRDHTLDKGAKALGPVMKEEAKKFGGDVVYLDTYSLFSDSEGGYSSSLRDAHGDLVQMRISDGVHFTVDGATYLANAVWKLLSKRWHIMAQWHPSTPIQYTIAKGSNDYVPGVGHYRPSVAHHSSSTTVPQSSVTATTGANANAPSTTAAATGPTTPPTAPPKTTTPPTAPPATTPPATSPPATTPPKKAKTPTT